MGFGKRGSADYYSPEELQDSDYEYGDQEEEEEDEEDIPGTLISTTTRGLCQDTQSGEGE